MELVRIDADYFGPNDGLYVVKGQGKCISTLGFDYVQRLTMKVALWLQRSDLIPEPSLRGSSEALDLYAKAMEAGADKYAQTGERCHADINIQLAPYLGSRVEVTNQDGEKERFWVGRSTGWMPTLLRIKSKRSSGGDAISYGEKFESVKVISVRH